MIHVLTTESVDLITSNSSARQRGRDVTRRVEVITTDVQEVIAAYLMGAFLDVKAHEWEFRGEIIGIADVSASSIAVTLRPRSLVIRGRNIG